MNKNFIYDIKSVVSEALKKDTMNEAVFLIQEFLGIDSGDNASIFFSGIDEDYYDNMDFSKRKNLLLDYIKHEILY